MSGFVTVQSRSGFDSVQSRNALVIVFRVGMGFDTV